MFKHAIVRRPAHSAVLGLTTVDLGKPEFDLLMPQYEHYLQTLKALGLEITELEPLEDYPDSYFIEDVAIVTPELAVVTRPGADQRRGETEHVADALAKHRPVEFIKSPGTLDGGDVLIVQKHCVVGLSERTNQSGAEQLCTILAKHGYMGDIVVVPEALHFKSSVNFANQDTLLVTKRCFDLDCLASYKKLVVPDGEEYAANVVEINGTILMPMGFPGTRELLIHNGFKVIEMPVSEIAKMDGGLTCLSLRLT